VLCEHCQQFASVAVIRKISCVLGPRSCRVHDIQKHHASTMTSPMTSSFFRIPTESDRHPRFGCSNVQAGCCGPRRKPAWCGHSSHSCLRSHPLFAENSGALPSLLSATAVTRHCLGWIREIIRSSCNLQAKDKATFELFPSWLLFFRSHFIFSQTTAPPFFCSRTTDTHRATLRTCLTRLVL
jgi:hypothetical protein